MGKITDLSGKLQGRRRILICPLDWGLGHASRCVPIIERALLQGIEVEIASAGGAELLLKKRFPELIYHQLSSYKVRYPTNYLFWNFILLLPHLLYAIAVEHRILHKLIKVKNYDLIISDNRMGCFSRQVPCVYLTHQLRFVFRQKWMSLIASRVHAFWYRQFNEIWVPDFPPPDNLSGVLSVPLAGDEPFYLGPFSQFEGVLLPPKKIKYRSVIILSGPEPQRSLLEREIMDQLRQLSGPFLLIRGLPEGGKMNNTYNHIKVISFAGVDEMAQILAQSELIICRAGYSSIMDLHHLQKKALLIPTPGQPEQEYLGRWHMGNDQFQVQEQGRLNLREIM